MTEFELCEDSMKLRFHYNPKSDFTTAKKYVDSCFQWKTPLDLLNSYKLTDEEREYLILKYM